MTVFIRDLEFYAYHGVPDAEQEIGHRYRADVELELVDCPAASTDEVADTVDYALVALWILEWATKNRYRTVEHLANLLCSKVIERFPQVAAVSIEIAKPMPPAPFIAREVGVRLRMVRS